MTFDTWRVGEGEISLKIAAPIALMACKWKCFEDLFTNYHWLTDRLKFSMSEKVICRTAWATTSMVINRINMKVIMIFL